MRSSLFWRDNINAMKKRVIWWKITNYHFFALIVIYFGMSMLQIGLPERYESTRSALSQIQLVMLGFLGLLTVINLFRNWK